MPLLYSQKAAVAAIEEDSSQQSGDWTRPKARKGWRERIWRRATYFKLGAARHHLGKGNTDTFDNGQQNGTANGTVPGGLVPTSNGQRATSEETRNDGIVWILLLADALDGTVKRREQATPYTKVAAEHRRPHLDGCDGAYSSLAVGRVSVTLDAVPYRTANSLQDMYRLARGRARAASAEQLGRDVYIRPYKRHHQNRSKSPRGKGLVRDPW